MIFVLSLILYAADGSPAGIRDVALVPDLDDCKVLAGAVNALPERPKNMKAVCRKTEPPVQS